MTNHHCPSCHSLTAPDGTVLRSDGKSETLYRCNRVSCKTVFSHALPTAAAPAKRVQSYNQARKPQDVIRTDC